MKRDRSFISECSIIALALVALAHAKPTTAAADVEAKVASIVKDLEGKDWAAFSAAVYAAERLVDEHRAGDSIALLPLVEPLYAHAGYGGIGRRESQLAAEIIARTGKPAVPFLLTKLDSDDARERRVAIEVLPHTGEVPAELAPRFAQRLADRDTYVRVEAIEALDACGEAAKPEMEQIKVAFADTHPAVRIYARRAAIHINGPSDEHIDAIAAALASNDQRELEPSIAATVLGELGPLARRAAPQLRAALEHPWAQARVDAAAALGKIGADTEEDVDALLRVLRDDPAREARRSAAGALGRIGTSAGSAVPALRQALSNPGGGWWVAAEALGRIGTPEAQAALREALDNPDPDIQRTAAAALKRF